MTNTAINDNSKRNSGELAKDWPNQFPGRRHWNMDNERVCHHAATGIVKCGREMRLQALNKKATNKNERNVMNNKFDELAKGMAQSVTRRQALKKFGLGLTGIALACFGLANKAEAGKGGCKPAGDLCGKGGNVSACKNCCSGSFSCDPFTTPFLCYCSS